MGVPEEEQSIQINEAVYLRHKLSIVTYQRDNAIDEQAKYFALVEQLSAQIRELTQEKGSKEDG